MMNDEIKEIKINTLGQLLDFVETEEKAKLLIDYITNLQQENEDNLKCIKSIKEQLESVINENQRLLNKWFENNDKTVELISEKEVYYNNFKDYKSRCEKADEYIKEMDTQLEVYGDYDILSDNKNDLLNILNGDKSE